MQAEIVTLAQQVGEALQAQGWTIATAESCTGGLIAAALTEIAGSSAWFDSAVVSYSNRAKQIWLQVSPITLAKHGAVSEAVVIEMAQAMRQQAQVSLALAVSGIAGPGGGSAQKPVGTVWVGWCIESLTFATCLHLKHGRAAIRQATVIQAFKALLSAVPSPR